MATMDHTASHEWGPRKRGFGMFQETVSDWGFDDSIGAWNM